MKDCRYIYKQKASDNMADKYNAVIPVLFVIGAISFVINLITSKYQPKYTFTTAYQIIQTDPGKPGVVFLLSLLSWVIATWFLYGTTRMFIETARNQTPITEDILTVGFKEQREKTLIISFLISLLTALWSLLLIIPGIVKSYAYSMSFYLIHQEPELSATDAIDLSNRLTRGSKMDLFLLDLSYIGWYILGIFTFGILWLWIAPKHRTARTLYFEEIYHIYNPGDAQSEIDGFSRNTDEE